MTHVQVVTDYANVRRSNYKALILCHRRGRF
jgi:hypothetical protein